MGNQKLRNYWVAKTLMSSYILCKFSTFKENLPETIPYIGLKVSDITELVCSFYIQRFYFIGFIR